MCHFDTCKPVRKASVKWARDNSYPIANVLQSDEGANDVTGIWSKVLDEICSDVVGSNSIILPCILPVCFRLVKLVRKPLRAPAEFTSSITYQRQRYRSSSMLQQSDVRRMQIGRPHPPSPDPRRLPSGQHRS